MIIQLRLFCVGAVCEVFADVSKHIVTAYILNLEEVVEKVEYANPYRLEDCMTDTTARAFFFTSEKDVCTAGIVTVIFVTAVVEGGSLFTLIVL